MREVILFSLWNCYNPAIYHTYSAVDVEERSGISAEILKFRINKIVPLYTFCAKCAKTLFQKQLQEEEENV